MTDFSDPDPLYIGSYPTNATCKNPLKPLWNTLTGTLATCLEKSVSIIRKLIPLKSDSQDMSFVRVSMIINITSDQYQPIYIYPVSACC